MNPKSTDCEADAPTTLCRLIVQKQSVHGLWSLIFTCFFVKREINICVEPSKFFAKIGKGSIHILIIFFSLPRELPWPILQSNCKSLVLKFLLQPSMF